MKILSWLWKAIGPRRIGLVVMCVYAAWLVFFYHYHWVDGINLLIHQAGHLFFALLGGRESAVGVAGGPFLQLAIPVALALRLWRRGESVPAAVCGLWSAESLMYTAEYLADANRLALPLVGGHAHDWRLLLERAGALESAEEIGLALHILASLAAAGAVWRTIRLESDSGG